MLRDSLYNIISMEHEPGLIIASIKLNKSYEIFQGHFPGQPVLPGACMLQMVKEILQGEMHISLQLKKAAVMKFLEMITPHENKLLQVHINYQQQAETFFHINAFIKCDEKTYFKFNGIYEKK